MIRTLPISQVREQLATLVNNAKSKLDEYVITVNGKPAAVLISADEFESWKETNWIESDQHLLGAIAKGEKDVSQGKVYSLAELKKELRLGK